jgi:hypothetical protein
VGCPCSRVYRSAITSRPRPPISPSDREFLHRCRATSCSQALRGCIRKTAIISVDNSVGTAKYNACMQGGSFVGRLLQSSRPRQELTTGKQTQSAAGISSERQRAKHGRYNSDE